MSDDAVNCLRNHPDAYGCAGLGLFVRSTRVQDQLTLIITTSIIPIHPETRLMYEVLASHVKHEPSLRKCKKIIVCDHPKVSVSGTRQYKSGKVLEQDFIRYNEYISRLEAMANANEYPFENTFILRCNRYRGFAMAVRDALAYVQTDYVMIIQHDRVLMRPFNVQEVLSIMRNEPSVYKYIGLASRKSEGHLLVLTSRYKIDVDEYINVLEDDPEESRDEFVRRIVVGNEVRHNRPRRVLVPLIFWYDSTHIASTEHYKKFVFGHHLIENVSCFQGRPQKLFTGDFIEDKLGQVEREDIKANGMGVHSKYGTYLLTDYAGPFVQHCHGRMIGTSNARTFEIYFGDDED